MSVRKLLVARAVSDGYSLIGTSPGPFVISPLLTTKPTYATKDFAPCAKVPIPSATRPPSS